MARWYHNAPIKALNAEIDLDDGMVWTLHTSTYALDRAAHDYVNDLTNELATAGGYTSGGLAAGAITRTLTTGTAWGVVRANSTAYAVDDVVRPATPDGNLYRAAVAGTSGGGIPTYGTTLGQCTTDGGVTWENVGTGIIVIGMANPSWATATFGPCRYAVLSDRTAGTAATQPLVGYIDFGSDKTGGGGTFTITLHAALGALHIFMP